MWTIFVASLFLIERLMSCVTFVFGIERWGLSFCFSAISSNAGYAGQCCDRLSDGGLISCLHAAVYPSRSLEDITVEEPFCPVARWTSSTTGTADVSPFVSGVCTVL